MNTLNKIKKERLLTRISDLVNCTVTAISDYTLSNELYLTVADEEGYKKGIILDAEEEYDTLSISIRDTKEVSMTDLAILQLLTEEETEIIAQEKEEEIKLNKQKELDRVIASITNLGYKVTKED